jgi:hypothetical protein
MTNPRLRQSGGGASVALLLAILIGALGAGAWNYHRNLVAEREARAERPLHGYETSDLEALAAAYRAEVETLTRRYDGVRTQRVEARERGFFGDQIEEYERVRRRSGSRRDVGAELGETEAALRGVEQELLARRSELGTPFDIHLRRLLTF